MMESEDGDQSFGTLLKQGAEAVSTHTSAEETRVS